MQQQPPSTITAALRDEDIAATIQTTLLPILAPLVAEIALQRQAVERQGDQLVAQAEQLGALSERLVNVERDRERLAAALRAAEDMLVDSYAHQERPRPLAAPQNVEAATRCHEAPSASGGYGWVAPAVIAAIHLIRDRWRSRLAVTRRASSS
jgi:chromosome segregation ATPase